MVSNNSLTLYVLVGLPGSGKSTWIKSLLKNSTEEFHIAIILILLPRNLERLIQMSGKNTLKKQRLTCIQK